MFKNLLFTFILFVCPFLTIYPSKKENTNLIDYCYSLEKILSRNSLKKGENITNQYNSLAQDITLFGTKKTKGALVNKIIDQYKKSKKSLIIDFVPNKYYCLAGYWIEVLNPGTFQSIFFEKSKEKIDQYKNIKKEVDGLFKDINSEYKFFKKEINDFF